MKHKDAKGACDVTLKFGSDNSLRKMIPKDLDDPSICL